MPDLHMTPETLHGHGEGCASLADKFGQLSELLHQARVDDQCFGPIGDAVGLSSSYFQNLEECQKLASQARDFLKHTKQSLDDTTKDYEQNEQQIITMLEDIGKEIGS